MKKVFYFMGIALLTAMLCVSCKKDNSSNLANTQDVADDIASSLGTSNSGLSSDVIQTAQLSEIYTSSSLKSALLDTIYKVDTSFTKASLSGATITYSYTYHLQYGFVLSGVTLNNAYFNNTINGSFDATLISSTDNRISNWVLTGLAASSNNYILNGTTTRTGSSQSKIRNKSKITSTSQITLSNVQVNKTTLAITEGTLNWNISGTDSSQSFSYSAVVTYLGGGKAQLTLNGTNYTIDLSTGQTE